MAAIHIELNQQTRGTAYQKLSYKIIDALIDNPEPTFIIVELRGSEFRHNQLVIERVTKQLDWFVSRGYKVILNGLAF